MIHPHLKTRDGERFAVLLEPAVNVNNDVELEAALTWHGRAVIVPYDGWTWVHLPPVTLSPTEFRETWQGD